MWASSWWMLFCWREASDTHSMVAHCQPFCQPGPRYSSTSDVPISAKWCPAAGGLQRLYCPVGAEKAFFSLWDQAFCFIRQWSWLSALCRIQPGSCSSSAGCFSRRTRTSLQGEAMRQQRNDAAPELSMGNTMLVTVGWGLLYGLDCWWLCTVITGPDYFGLQGNAVNGREFGSACVFSCWWTHKELFAVRV